MNSNNTERMNRALTGTTSRRQALKLLGGGAMAVAGIAGVNDATARPQGRANLLTNLPVAGTVQDGTGRTFTGTATLTHLTLDGDGNLFADGTLAGMLSDGTTVKDSFTATPISLEQGTAAVEGRRAFAQQQMALAGQSAAAVEGGRAFAQQGGSCPILNLRIGPVTLDVLGLVIEIGQAVVLNIRAERGPGNLLGNLLCALAGLLDDFNLAGAQGVLNRINQLLR